MCLRQKKEKAGQELDKKHAAEQQKALKDRAKVVQLVAASSQQALQDAAHKIFKVKEELFSPATVIKACIMPDMDFEKPAVIIPTESLKDMLAQEKLSKVLGNLGTKYKSDNKHQSDRLKRKG